MITGTVTAGREAVVPIQLEGPNGERANVQAAIDTGFTDFLVVPSRLMRRLSLPTVGAKAATLADGSVTTLSIVAAFVHRHGQPLLVPALQADGGTE